MAPRSAPKSAPKATKTRRARLEARESAIVSAAQEIFSKAGFDGARMSDIAKAAGVSEGTLYLYFENKLALMQAVLTDYYTGLSDAADQGVRKLSDPRERLHFLAHLHVERMLGNWQILMQASFVFRDHDQYAGSTQYKLNKSYVATFDMIIRDAQSRGEMPDDVALWALRDLFFGGLEYAMRTARVRGESDARAVADAVMPAFYRACGLSDAEPSQPTDRLEALVERLESAVERVTQGPRKAK